MKLPNGIYDGELCIFEDDKENFKKAVSEIKVQNHNLKSSHNIKRKAGVILNPRYCIFDHLTFKEFESKSSDRIYSERMEDMKKLLEGKKSEPYVRIVEIIKIKDKTHLEKLSETATSREWEGLILRKDIEYEGKRTNNMVKVKTFQQEEFKVVDMNLSMMRFYINGGIDSCVVALISKRGYRNRDHEKCHNFSGWLRSCSRKWIFIGRARIFQGTTSLFF
jgi:DNA ligase 1